MNLNHGSWLRHMHEVSKSILQVLFGKLFTSQTIITEPLTNEIADYLKNEIMEKRKKKF